MYFLKCLYIKALNTYYNYLYESQNYNKALKFIFIRMFVTPELWFVPHL